ncbi:hypothetical protein EDD15DRAFT_2369089 [Pisolithus albus]|nr:hypothetical protein EDD15DRAFT_2369089 [Pisolithus albus]
MYLLLFLPSSFLDTPGNLSFIKQGDGKLSALTKAMANTEQCWVVIGSDNSARVYGSEDCPFIACGRQTPILPLAIQCKTRDEAGHVARTLQPTVHSLPPGADYTQILVAFDNPLIQTLLEDEAGFYAIVIVHSLTWYSESAAHAEGSFRYHICRQTTSFWTVLAFMIVKGVSQCMPPVLTYSETGTNAAPDSLAEQFHHSLTISPHSPQTTSTSSLTSLPSPGSSFFMPSHTSLLSPGSLFFTSSTSEGSPTPSTTSPPSSEAAISPIIYSHIHNLRGVVSSNYHPTSTRRIRHLARPLSDLAACYLASHGYGTEDVDHIIQVHRRARRNEDLAAFLARQGMSVNEAYFLLQLIDLCGTLPR